MNKFYFTLVFFIPVLAYASSWDSLNLKQEANVELIGRLVVVDNYISGTEAYLCKQGVEIKKEMINCIDLVSESLSLLELKSMGCVLVTGSFRKYSDEFVFMGSVAEVGLLKLESSNNIKKC